MKKNGFTLVEFVITVAIFGVISIIIGKFAQDIFANNRYFDSALSNVSKAQKLLRPMGQEIRSAAQSNTGSYAIATYGTTDFAFYSDIDNDGLLEWVRYYLSGTSLMKSVIKPTGNPLTYNSANTITTTIVTGVRNATNGNVPIFNYYNSSYNGGASGEVTAVTGPVTDIRVVRITLYIDSDVNKPPPVQVVTTLVTVRNLKQQL